MSAEDIFRDAAGCSPDSSAVYSDGPMNLQVRLVEELHAVLHEGSKRRRLRPNTHSWGREASLAVTVSAVPAADGSLLGVACLIRRPQ